MESKEIVKFGGMEVHFCLDAPETNYQITMFKVVVMPNTRMPAPHYHESFDETVYGLKGTTTFTVAGSPVEIGEGDGLFIPRGVVHGFENKTQEIIEFLAIVNPGVFRPVYFKEIAEIINAGGPPDMQKLWAVMQRHGLVPVMG